MVLNMAATHLQILNLLGQGKDLYPLMDQEMLLEHLRFEDATTAHRFINTVFPESSVEQLEGIEVLIKLLVKRKASSAEAYEDPLNSLPYLIQGVHSKLNRITSILRSPVAPAKERFANNSKMPDAYSGSLRLKLLELLPIVVDLGYKAIDLELLRANTLGTCIDIFLGNPTNVFIHNGVSALLLLILKIGRQVLLEEAIVKCKILDKILHVFQEESKKPVATRADYFFHFIKLANEIEAIPSSHLKEMTRVNEAWVNFVKKDLNARNELDHRWSVLKPDRPPQREGIFGVRNREEALATI